MSLFVSLARAVDPCVWRKKEESGRTMRPQAVGPKSVCRFVVGAKRIKCAPPISSSRPQTVARERVSALWENSSLESSPRRVEPATC